jgi:hypothetical protein
MCGFDIVGLVRPGLVFNKAASLNLYVQLRSRKIRSKIGIGIPRSQSKMYPVAPASLILFVKHISDILLLVIDSEVFVVRRNLLRLMKTHNRAGGWLSSPTKSYPPSDD